MELDKMIKEKSTLKEINFLTLLKVYKYCNMLFITSFGQIIGKPYDNPEGNQVSSHILLSDVIIISNGTKNNYGNFTFTLFIDQIIAVSPIDRDVFLSQIEIGSN